MAKEPPIQRLSNEILRHILDQIEPDPERTVPIDDRRFISVESFELAPPSDSVKDIGRFRLTCHRFAEVGAPLLFIFVKGRFSKRGLERLEEFAGWGHLTGHVKKFSYLVPYLYYRGERTTLPGVENRVISANMMSLQRKANEQQKILKAEEDLRILKKAFQTFTSLQFVKLLPVAEEEDRQFKEYIQRQGHQNFVDAYWAPAISHGSQTIGKALISADVPWSRLYLPVESVRSVAFLASQSPPPLFNLAARLTCLTLVFDEVTDLDEKMTELSELFRTVFTSAKDMQAVHIGFPRQTPLNLPLEDVFHNVTWGKLVALGVAGWDLHAEEIIALALRHREKLKGLRLRDVRLKEGSMWKDVLGTLKGSMHRLKWVSLRRIGYVARFEEINGGGAEVPDDQPWALSDSSDSENIGNGPRGEEDHYTGSSDFNGHANGSLNTSEPWVVAGPSNFMQHCNGHPTAEELSATSDDTDEEHEPESIDTDFPNLDSPTTSAPPPWPEHHEISLHDSAEDIDDNGSSVSNVQRKAWERWVVRRNSGRLER
ncbi:hypothetical protein LTR37_018743 [Vermiconidia calcicola]|uniref:Uncharacterized protein n=1 Tax=Vermiconidia calcicola TaxID=1690605 RepID=A0ACC3MHE3_9PEZI|nr:hypothetical protein LTR37_018743 [Vermiconidia calcicola]